MLRVNNSVIDANLEYGIKTEGLNYITELDTIGTVGPPNRFADYYSAKLHRRLGFNKVQNDIEIKNVEEGVN